MERTLIGVFDSNEQARAARDQIVAAGISPEMVQVRSGDIGTDAAAIQHTEPPEHHWNFFDWLFGNADGKTEGEQYAEAVRRGHCLVVVDRVDDPRVDQTADILTRNGAIDIDSRVEQWREQGWTGYDANAPRMTGDEIRRDREAYTVGAGPAAGDAVRSGTGAAATTASTGESDGTTTRIPVVEEQLEVGKRMIQRGGVRVYTRTTERPVEEDVTLREERARVERHAVDRPATEADLANAFKEGSVEVRESAEEAVVAKTAHVVEEVEVGKDVSERTEKVTDKVRRSDVEVEDLPATRTPGPAGDRPPLNRR